MKIMILRRLFVTLVSLFVALTVAAQDIRWSHSVREEGEGKYTLCIEANIEKGWHIYGVTPNEFTNPTVITFTPSEGVTLEGKLRVKTPEHTLFEPTFGVEITQFEGKVLFEQDINTTAKDASVKVAVEYQACTEGTCTAPTDEEFVCRIGGAAPTSEAPQTAIAVRIGNGYSSTNAMLTAKDILQYHFKLASEDEIITGTARTDSVASVNID